MLDRSATTLGDYQLHLLLAEGETGDLYRATTATGELVLLKVVRPALAQDTAFRAALRMQTLALRGLRHRHIIEVREVSTREDACFVVMEPLEGTTLRDLIAGSELANLPLTDRMTIAYQVALALAHAHEHGFIHGSVTPDDIFLQTDTDVCAKLADFGLGWLAIHTESAIDIWRESLAYAMPPERCHGLDLDLRIDIYALGAILYELATGTPPFVATSLDAAVFRHVYTQPLPPHQIAPDISPALEEIILRCLAKDPAARFASAGELAEALRQTGAQEHVDFPEAPDLDAVAHTPNVPPPDIEPDQVAVSTPPQPTEQITRQRRPAVPRAPLALVNQTVGGYHLDAYLGASETGDVYRGRDQNGQITAIKLIHDGLAADSFFEANFDEQAIMLRALSHPQLVRVIAAGEDAMMLFVAFEWLPDGTLRNLLQRRTDPAALPLRMGIELVRQAAVGLEYIHAQGLIHGGIKPNNLLLTRRGDSTPADYDIKLGDTGLAWLALHSDTPDAIWPDTLIYAMPPERCQGLELDYRADLYALGVILYELATGSPPFEAKTLDAAVFRHVYTQPTPPRQLAPATPVDLEAIILRCLSKRPTDRFPTAGALADALQALLESAALAPAALTQPLIMGSAPPVTGPFTPRVSALDQYGRSVGARELTGEGIRIGSATDNDIVLQGAAVAPYHLQIDWDGRTALASNIADHGETYQGEQVIAPQETRPWGWETPMRVGPFWLRVEAVPLVDAHPPTLPTVEALATSETIPITATPVEAPVEQLSERIGVTLDQRELALTPGRPATFRVALANLGNIVDHFTVTAEGIPPEWQVGTSPVLQLNPNAQGLVTLNVLVAAVPEYHAGVYPVSIRARSRESRNESNVAPATWTVLPFLGSTFDMRQKKLKRRRKARYPILIRNLGNAGARYTLSASDDDEALGYEFAEDVVALEPGTHTKNTVIVRPNRTHVYGQPVSRRFSVQMKPVSGEGEIHSVAAQLDQAALIPRWSVVLLTLALAWLAIWMWLAARPTIFVLETNPAVPVQGEPFFLRWQTNNATTIELTVNGTAVPLKPDARRLLFRGVSAPASVELVAKNRVLAQSSRVLEIVPVQPTPTPTVEPSPTNAPIPTDAPPLPTELPPTAPPIPPPTPPPPTSTPTIVPTPTSQTLCAPGQTTDIRVQGGRREPYLVSFDARVISGGQLGDDGRGIVRLGPFNEQPGRYQVEIRSRTSGALLREVTCVVPSATR